VFLHCCSHIRSEYTSKYKMKSAESYNVIAICMEEAQLSMITYSLTSYLGHYPGKTWPYLASVMY
jgi:hypothetical protein